MTRCKHLRCTISEVGETDWHYRFAGGRLTRHSSYRRPASGRVLVRCGECGLERAYSVGSWPKWLGQLIRQIPRELRDGSVR